MREGGKQLRRLGLAAVFVLAASATPALSQANPACGVARRRLAMAGPSTSLKASASMAHGCAASRRG